MKSILPVFLLSLILVCCNRESGEKKHPDNSGGIEIPEKQLNISILLDLSDRITVPGIQGNDIENIKTITEYYKSNMNDLGAYNAKGKIRIFFSPAPLNSNINSMVSRLNIDCSKMDNKGRKKVYEEITELYAKNLESIYQETSATSAWNGADIWRFFKDDVKDFCIVKDTSYRNILIILTDGYLYHQQSFYNDANRYTYLLGSKNLNRYRSQNWNELIEQDNFGIITERVDLNELEVLVLEVKAENQSNKIDEDILRFIWKKWFEEMKISHYEVYHSDLPANTKLRIENFLNFR